MIFSANLMKKIISILSITRPINVLITFAVVIVATIICSDSFKWSAEIFLAGLSAAIVAGGGNIINDYFDYEIDKINKPNRLLPLGLITRIEALSFYFVLSLLSILLSINISVEAFIIVSATNALLYFYSAALKKIPLLGNLVVATCTALAFIYGGVVAGNIYAAIFALLVNLIREIIKDIEDIDGDKKNQLETYPIKYGIKKSKALLIGLLIVLFTATMIPIILKLYNIEYFIIVMFFVNLPLIYLIREISSKQFLINISKLSAFTKLIMIFGLIAIYLG